MRPFYEEHKAKEFEYIEGIRQQDRLIPALRPSPFQCR